MKKNISFEVEKLRKRIESKEALDFVFNRLSKIQELPEDGFCAGQAVSSAIVEYLGLENEIAPVYNDIDVFTPDKYSIAYNATGIKEIVSNPVENVSPSFFMGIVNNSEYVGLSSGVFYNYNIKNVESNEKINNIFIEVGRYSGTFPSSIDSPDEASHNLVNIFIKHILDSFDINTTKAGFHLSKKSKIVVDDKFLLFLLTKQIEIDKMPHPIHAYLRALKKRDELGVYFNDKKYRDIIFPYLKILENIHKHLDDSYLLDVSLMLSPKSENKKSFFSANLPVEFAILNKKRILSSPKYIKLYHDYSAFFPDIVSSPASENSLCLSYSGDISPKQVIDRFFNAGGEIIAGKSDKPIQVFKKKLYEISDGKLSKYVRPIFENLKRETKEEKHFHDFYTNKMYKYGKKYKELSKEDQTKMLELYKIGRASGFVANTIFSIPEYIVSLEEIRNSTLPSIQKIIEENLNKGVSGFIKNNFISEKDDFIRRVKDGHITADELESYFKEVKKISKQGHFLFLKHLLNDVHDIRLLTKILSVINKESLYSKDFIGKIESDITTFLSTWDWDIFLEDGFVSKYMEKDRKEKKKDLRPDIPKENRFFSSPYGNFTAELLTTKESLEKEGDRMNHCVSGYSTAVEDKRSLIFKMSGKNSEGGYQRFTMELSSSSHVWSNHHLSKLKDLPAYSIAQMRGKNNEAVIGDENLIAILLEINKTFQIIKDSDITQAGVIEAFSSFLKTDISIDRINLSSFSPSFIPSLLSEPSVEEKNEVHLSSSATHH